MLDALKVAAFVRGGIAFHVRKAQGQDLEGLPDAILIAPPVVGLFELKTQRDRLSERQRYVLDLLARCDRIASGIVRPNPRDGELSLDDALELLR